MASLSVDKLLVYDPSKSASAMHVFIAHPAEAEEKTLGKILILTEVASRDPFNEGIIKQIQETIRESYYQTDELNIETAFEQTLEKANLEIANMVSAAEQDIISKVNIIVAACKDKYIYFSAVGNVNAFLCHRHKISDVLAEYKRYDDKVNPLKFFSNIVNGSLSENDTMILTTPAILDFFSQEKLRRVVTDYSPQEASQMLENLLQDAPETASLAALFIKLVPEHAAQKVTLAASSAREYLAPQSSLERLEQSRDATERLLTPSLTRYMGETMRRSVQQFSYFIRTKLFKQSPRRVQFMMEKKYYASYATQRVRSRSIFASVGRALRLIFLPIITGVRFIINLLIEPRQATSSLQQIPRSFFRAPSRLVRWFKNLTNVQKMLALVAVIVALIFSQAMIQYGKGQFTEQMKVNFSETVALVSQKILEAEARISYGDDQGAKTILEEAKALVANLPTRKQDQKDKVAELSASIEQQLGKTRKQTTIDQPTVLFDFATLGQSLHMAHLALIKNNLYAFSTDAPKLFAVDLETGKASPVAEEDIQTSFQYMTGTSADTILMLRADYTLAEFSSKTNKVTAQTFSLPTQDVNISAIASYENRLYLLDVKNNQIYRSSRITGGFNQASAWIKQAGINVQDGQSLAIDGTMYVGKANGEVIKLLQGNQQEFALDSVEPKLEHIDKIWTNASSERLYVLDGAGKRVLIFTKKGNLLRQYFSSQFNEVRDFAVSESLKKIYILNGSKVFQIDVTDIS